MFSKKKLDVVRKVELAVAASHSWAVTDPSCQSHALASIDVGHCVLRPRSLHWKLRHATLEALYGEHNVELLIHGPHCRNARAIQEPLSGSTTRLQQPAVVNLCPVRELVLRHAKHANHGELAILLRPADKDPFQRASLVEKGTSTVSALRVFPSNPLVQLRLLRWVVEEIVHEMPCQISKENAAKTEEPPRGPAFHDRISGSELVQDLKARVRGGVGALLPRPHFGPDNDIARVVRRVVDGDVLVLELDQVATPRACAVRQRRIGSSFTDLPAITGEQARGKMEPILHALRSNCHGSSLRVN
mmetsp:Transcript_71782/g.168036  ORF Transcript_71782/g.168036 Transcript_71782/m.168036 type:complete len:303 (+) Transcript_71782:929-1837(+)